MNETKKNTDIQNEVISTIKSVAEQKGYTAHRLAKEAGLPATSPEVLKIMRGKYEGTKGPRNLQRLMEVLGIEWKLTLKAK